MPPVFAHGRLRLYLLKLLDESPRHGYEIIRLLEERFQGLYAPSAGTVYPRLAKLEAEGLVTHSTEGGRKVYSLTPTGRAELADRQGELAELELDIRESVSALAADIREDVSGAAGDLRREMREAALRTRTKGHEGPFGEGEAWQQAKEDFRQAKEEWKEQARRAKEESRRARQDAQQARRQAKQAQDHLREETRRIAERVQERMRGGDWPKGLVEGVTALTQELGNLANGRPAAASGPDVTVERVSPPEWATAADALSKDPARDLDRLLDRFRDDIRDAARDHGVTPSQLAASRDVLAEAATRIAALLTPPQG